MKDWGLIPLKSLFRWHFISRRPVIAVFRSFWPSLIVIRKKGGRMSGSLSQARILIEAVVLRSQEIWLRLKEWSLTRQRATAIELASYNSILSSHSWSAGESLIFGHSQCSPVSMESLRGTCTAIATLEPAQSLSIWPTYQIDTSIWPMMLSKPTQRIMANSRAETNFRLMTFNSIWTKHFLKSTSSSWETSFPGCSDWLQTLSALFITWLILKERETDLRFSGMISWSMNNFRCIW